MSNSSSDCFYLSLVDAKKAVGVKVNLMAVVSDVEEPTRKSRGTDYYTKLKIVEPSSEAEMFVVFFSETIVQLPRVRSPGDIISLHHVEVRIDKGACYCVHRKLFSSSALFDGKAIQRFIPYRAYGKYKPTGYEKKYLLQMRPWSREKYSMYSPFQLQQQLRRITMDQNFDIVLHVCKRSDGCWALFVWDGTDTPPASFETDFKCEGENPSPLQLDGVFLPREVLIAFPPVGTVLPVIADKSFAAIHRLRSGQWAELVNMKFELNSGIWLGKLHRVGGILSLPDEDYMVKFLLKNYEERIACKVQRRPLTSFPKPSHIIETDYNEVAYSTLRESLVHKKVNHKIKSVVRVIAAYPWRNEHFCFPSQGICAIRLTLEDPTARVHAYIHGDGILKFFNGHTASDVLFSNMNKLLGICDIGDTCGASVTCPPRKPPWVWFCLKSYYLDKQDPIGSRKYMVFGTTLVG